MGRYRAASLAILLLSIGITFYKDMLVDWCQQVWTLEDLLSQPTSKEKSSSGDFKVFTKKELSQFKGHDGGPIYLALTGLVFDVSRGVDYYGPGGGYHFFAGVDGTRAFVTGEFTDEGLIDDVTGLQAQDYLGLQHWVDFYQKDYALIGRLEGRFYDASGQPTAYFYQFQRWVFDSESGKKSEEEVQERFPQCNVEYKPESGTRMWCTKASGGVKRDWVGVPRKLYSQDRKSIRCACVKDEDLAAPLLELYSDCHPQAVSCRISG